MPRRVLNPNALPAKPTPEQIRRALVDMWYLISEYYEEVTADYSVTQSRETAKQFLSCDNTSSITVTLVAEPEDGDEMVITRRNAQVTVSGNGKNINGSASQVIVAQYDSMHLEYREEDTEWRII